MVPVDGDLADEAGPARDPFRDRAAVAAHATSENQLDLAVDIAAAGCKP